MVRVSAHANDLGQLRVSEQYIANYTLRITSLKEDIKTIVGTDPSPKSATLLNADSPVKSMVDQLAVAESELTIRRDSLLQAQSRIETRKAGPLWFIVSIYGDR